MSFPQSIADDPSFDVFFSEHARIAGRRKTGASDVRELSIVVPCDVSEVEDESLIAGSIAPGFALAYVVSCRKSAWPEPLPPTAGLTVQIDGFPSMAIKHVIARRDEYVMHCTSTEAAP